MPIQSACDNLKFSNLSLKKKNIYLAQDHHTFFWCNYSF